MIPEHALSSTPQPATYLPPSGLNATPLESFERGGIALQDPSQGLQVQNWRCWVEEGSSQVKLRALTTGENYNLFEAPDITELSFCFDQSMRWVCVYVTEGNVEFRWYDSSVGDYVITSYPSTYKSPRLTLDDKRALSLPTSDIVLSYVRDTSLYAREQRDRYEIEYLLTDTLPPNSRILNFGMHTRLRLQWRFTVVSGE